MQIFSGRVHRTLAEDIAKHLGVPMGRVKVESFADGEIGIQIQDNVRGRDVFIIQPICNPVNDSLMELLLLISAMRRASAESITAVIPYYAYARQDRKFTSRVPISAADLAVMMSAMGVDRVISVDLHSGQIQGFFPAHVPVTNLTAQAFGAKALAALSLKNPVIVSPDASGVSRAKHFRDLLAKLGHEDASPDIAMVIEHRVKDPGGHLTESKTGNDRLDLVGRVTGSDCIIVGDIIDSAQTIVRAAHELKRQGAEKVYVFAPHGLFNGDAVKNIMAAPLEKVVCTNTTPLNEAARQVPDRVMQVSIAPLLAEAIKRVYQNRSVSSLFLHGQSNNGHPNNNANAPNAAAEH
jgi:ribose-phosphate pyrophosphokinase